jgi:hypothetical protein
MHGLQLDVVSVDAPERSPGEKLPAAAVAEERDRRVEQGACVERVDIQLPARRAPVDQIPRHPGDREEQSAQQGTRPALPAAPGAGRGEHAQRQPYSGQPGGGIRGTHVLSLVARPFPGKDF